MSETPRDEYMRLMRELGEREDYWDISKSSYAFEPTERRMDVLWIGMTQEDRLLCREYGRTLAHSTIGG